MSLLVQQLNEFSWSLWWRKLMNAATQPQYIKVMGCNSPKWSVNYWETLVTQTRSWQFCCTVSLVTYQWDYSSASVQLLYQLYFDKDWQCTALVSKFLWVLPTKSQNHNCRTWRAEVFACNQWASGGGVERRLLSEAQATHRAASWTTGRYQHMLR